VHIDQAELTVFDTETTGLSPRSGDRVVEIAAIRFKADQRLDQFSSLVKTDREISPGAFAVNRISGEMLKGAPAAGEVFRKFLDFAQGSPLFSYNAVFDAEFLTNELKVSGIKVAQKLLFLDVLKMARRLLPGLERYALWFVSETLGVNKQQEHRALSDSAITLDVFLKLKARLLQKGISELSSFTKLFAINKTFLDDVSGEKISQIQEAITLGGRLKIKYLTASTAAVSEREVIPKELRRQGNCDYLVGYCCLRQEERSFRIDAILHLEII